MRHLKKALSLTLALALALVLAVPAFADEPEVNWVLSIQGKPDEEVTVLPSIEFLSYDWDLVEDENGGSYTLTKTAEPVESMLEQVIVPEPGDTLVLETKAKENGLLLLQTLSDPDGDGVYEQRIRKILPDGNFELLPLGTESPIAVVRDEKSGRLTYNNSWYLDESGQFDWSDDIILSFDTVDNDGWASITIPTDNWLQYFGPNTIVAIFPYENAELVGNAVEGDPSGYWTILITDGSQASTPAEPEQPAAPDGISVTVGGTAVAWTDAKPFIDANDRTMVPLRAVADAMSLTVNWDGDARVASFTDGSKTISFPIDGSTAQTSDGGTVEMDTAAVIANERTYAPIRYLAEYFGYTVGWDGASQTVSLTK